MAHPEHLALVFKAEDWNRWRKEHPDVTPNLSLADLRSSDLGGTDLTHANLRGANLNHANLSLTDLRHAGSRKFGSG